MRKKQKINVKMPHVNKKTTSEKWKFNSNKKLGLEWAVIGLGKPFRKKSDPKNRKNSKNQSEIAACEQKTTTEKPNFCSNTVSHSTLKLEREKFTPQNHSLFRSISCFGVTKITTPIWLQKSWTCVNRSYKKRQHPNTIQILWIVKKNQEKANNSPSYRCAAINKAMPLYIDFGALLEQVSSFLKCSFWVIERFFKLPTAIINSWCTSLMTKKAMNKDNHCRIQATRKTNFNQIAIISKRPVDCTKTYNTRK